MIDYLPSVQFRPVAALCAVVLLAGRLGAQQVQGALSVGGGTVTDQRGIRSSAATVSPSAVVVPDPRLSLGLSGSATRFQTSAWAVGGTASAGTRLPLAGGLALAGSAAASGTTTSFHATYLTADATPTLEASLRGVTLFAGGHLAQGRTTVEEAASTPPTRLPTPAPSARATTVSRTSVGPVYGAVVALPTSRADVGGTLSYREERARVSDARITDRVVAGAWTTGAVTLGATAGARDAADERVQYGSLSATVALGRAVALQSAVGSYPSSRVLGTLGGRYATLGLVLRTATRGDEPEFPTVRGAPPVPAGATRLVLRAPAAHRVELAGDWSHWATVPATRADGLWYADVRLPRGEHRYAFRIDGSRWTVPEGATTVDDGFGGRSALLVVP